jgi:hypothetical protein
VHLVRATQTRLAFLPRIIVAVVLVLALLSGIAPFGSASAEHICTMECCAGLAQHAAGSCHMDMSSAGRAAGEESPKPESDRHCGLPEADNELVNGLAAGVMGMKEDSNSSLGLDAITIDASDHCNTNSQSKGVVSPSRNDSHPASIATQSFSKPCPPECGTGALSSGVRPSRQALALAYNGRPWPPTLVGKHHHPDYNFSIASGQCKQVRPRGPPVSFS